MSNPSSKARFYLEQAVPQLQEFEQKKIFTKDEIRTLVKKRSDFEHKVLARGSLPIDFARYAAWEISLETLRQKRCKRLRIKPNTLHSGQARIFNIFDRGTKKHPGDVALWMSYLECARQSKTTKKFKTVLTSAIRLHPTKEELWLYAARWSLESESDVNGARSYMQRGTRFCTRSRGLWVEYARLEMIYLAKIALRRRILGLDVDRTGAIEGAEDMDGVEGAVEVSGFDTSADEIAIPDFSANSLRPSMISGVQVDAEATKDPMTTPALNGAIPLAIFDAARKQPFFNAAAAEAFFDVFAAFTQVKCQPRLLQYVLDSMMEAYKNEPSTSNCYVLQAVVGIDPISAEFPAALGVALDRLKEVSKTTLSKPDLVVKMRAWVEPVLEIEGLDPGIQTVLRHTLRKLE